MKRSRSFLSKCFTSPSEKTPHPNPLLKERGLKPGTEQEADRYRLRDLKLSKHDFTETASKVYRKQDFEA